MSMSPRLIWLLRRAAQGCALIIAGILAAALMGSYTEHEKNSWVPSWHWVEWAFFTAVLAYAVWQDCRHTWRAKRVWLTLAALFVCHTIGYLVLFRFVNELRAVWFGLLMIAEYHTFIRIVRWVDPRIDDGSDRSRHVE